MALMLPLAVEDVMKKNQERKRGIFSFRNKEQAWDPKNQRPEMWETL